MKSARSKAGTTYRPFPFDDSPYHSMKPDLQLQAMLKIWHRLDDEDRELLLREAERLAAQWTPFEKAWWDFYNDITAREDAHASRFFVGGKEHLRIRSEWMERGRPVDVAGFIRRRATAPGAA